MKGGAKSARAFAPASVANVAVGFDILGFAFDGVGDEVSVTRAPEPGVRVTGITAMTALPAMSTMTGPVSGVNEIPADPLRNVAAVALQAMIDGLGLSHGFTVEIKKGIALSSGMGGSAASAVAAVVAAEAVLDKRLSREELFAFALQGEAAASGALHGDNVGPCLYGGLNLILPGYPFRCVPIQAPDSCYCLLVHPELKIETRAARGILKSDVSLPLHVTQSAWLAGFVAGCLQGDLGLIRECMRDIVIEPQRAALIPGFEELKRLALESGALGFSISGSGPSVFCWTEGRALAEKLAGVLSAAFSRHGLRSQAWVSPVQARGARIVTELG